MTKSLRHTMLAAFACIATAACGTEDRTNQGAPESTSTPIRTTSTPAPTKTLSMPDRDNDGIPDFSDAYPDDPSNIPPGVPASIDCSVTSSGQNQAVEVTANSSAPPDFSAAWALRADDCTVSDSISPVSGIEKAAYKASGYTDNDVSVLYAICAQASAEDIYLDPSWTPSPEQVKEMTGALKICPRHPHSKRWQPALARGRGDAKLEGEGRIFGPGTFLVGKEIRPGRYMAVDVENCYWARQSRAGAAIDNDFVPSARRVEVNVRSTDYAFDSKGCGQWRPAH